MESKYDKQFGIVFGTTRLEPLASQSHLGTFTYMRIGKDASFNIGKATDYIGV